MDIQEDYSYRTIPLQLDASFAARGLTAIDEYLKVLVCTEELDTDLFCQEGWTPDAPGSHRTLDLRRRPAKKDWRSLDVWLRVKQLSL